MKTFSLLALGLLACVSAACSSDAGAGDSDEPVAKSTLTGMIGGESFTARSATAIPGFDDDGTRRVEVYDTEVTCDTAAGGGRSVIASVPWQSGFASALSLNQNVTLYEGEGQNNVATSGRIEVIDAPAEGETGVVRIRAFIDDDNQVEGEIEVQVCPDPFAS